jgi:hypothetical protein
MVHKEVVMAYYEANLPGWTEERHKILNHYDGLWAKIWNQDLNTFHLAPAFDDRSQNVILHNCPVGREDIGRTFTVRLKSEHACRSHLKVEENETTYESIVLNYFCSKYVRRQKIVRQLITPFFLIIFALNMFLLS